MSSEAATPSDKNPVVDEVDRLFKLVTSWKRPTVSRAKGEFRELISVHQKLVAVVSSLRNRDV